jgi:hypothetical protein
MSECVERNEILEYKNIFGDNVWIIEDNLYLFKAQIDMEIMSDLGEYSGKFEFQYEDEGVNYKFCIFRLT